jgi:hypothetical protein
VGKSDGGLYQTGLDSMGIVCMFNIYMPVQIVGRRCFVVANSVGTVSALQAALYEPDLIKGVMLLDVSLRMLHVKKQVTTS